MQKLENFQYATALDTNMGYYTISTLRASQDMTTIVTEFDKFKYNCLPMGMWFFGDVFQAKVDKPRGDINVFKTYIYYILVLSKDIFSNHIEQFRNVFGRLRTVGLKGNAPKCSFLIKDIPYLVYLVTREGIKPDQKKVQEIMDLGQPTTNT